MRLRDQADRRPAFSIVELMVTLGVLAILISIIAPSLMRARSTTREMLCLNNARSLGQLVTLYSMDYQGTVPTIRSDRAAELNTERRLQSYLYFPTRAFAVGPMPMTTGLLPGHPTLRCPANQAVARSPTGNVLSIDYVLSAAFYVEASWLSPDLPAERSRPAKPKLQTLDSPAFPADKAVVFEDKVWHAWPGVFADGVDATALQPAFSSGRTSIAFADGHAEGLRAHEIGPFVSRAPEYYLFELHFTADGVLGRDRR